MTRLQKGENTSLPTAGRVQAVVEWDSAGVGLDAAAILLTGDGRVRSDADFVFFNQPRSQDGSVIHRTEGRREVIDVDLTGLPAEVARVTVTASVDAAAPAGTTFARVTGVRVSVRAGGGGEVVSYAPDGLTTETAVILLDLYRRDGAWKARAVGQGYAAGLAGIARDFGISVADEDPPAPPPPAPPPSPPPPAGGVTSFEKGVATLPSDVRVRLEKSSRAARVVLEKKGLTGVVARVALVVDASGSMSGLYKKQTVARAVERVMAVAGRFDDDGDMEVWIFGSRPKRLPVLQVSELPTYPGTHLKISRETGYGNDEPAVMRDILDYYAPGQVMAPPRKRLFGRRDDTATQVGAPPPSTAPDTAPPVFIVFLSDGGIYTDKDIERLLIDASRLPIFWQFVGIGSAKYGVLERLDSMAGRVVDNAGFFSVDDLDTVSDEVLYDRLLSEFPAWLRAARAASILA